jgi:hypothetical protein
MRSAWKPVAAWATLVTPIATSDLALVYFRPFQKRPKLTSRVRGKDR